MENIEGIHGLGEFHFIAKIFMIANQQKGLRKWVK